MLRNKAPRDNLLHLLMIAVLTIIGVTLTRQSTAAASSAEHDRTPKKNHKGINLTNPSRIVGPTAPLLNLSKTPDFITSGRNPAHTPTIQLSCSTTGGKTLNRGDAEYDECLRSSQTGRTPQEPAGTWGAPGTQLWLRN